jgi:hypothetical protein
LSQQRSTKIRDTFDCAIAACQASGFIHYEGHLSERLGIVLVELGHFEMASRYLSNAVIRFEAWSAAAKVRSTKEATEGGEEANWIPDGCPFNVESTGTTAVRCSVD